LGHQSLNAIEVVLVLHSNRKEVRFDKSLQFATVVLVKEIYIFFDKDQPWEKDGVNDILYTKNASQYLADLMVGF